MPGAALRLLRVQQDACVHSCSRTMLLRVEPPGSRPSSVFPMNSVPAFRVTGPGPVGRRSMRGSPSSTRYHAVAPLVRTTCCSGTLPPSDRSAPPLRAARVCGPGMKPVDALEKRGIEQKLASVARSTGSGRANCKSAAVASQTSDAQIDATWSYITHLHRRSRTAVAICATLHGRPWSAVCCFFAKLLRQRQLIKFGNFAAASAAAYKRRAHSEASLLPPFFWRGGLRPRQKEYRTEHDLARGRRISHLAGVRRRHRTIRKLEDRMVERVEHVDAKVNVCSPDGALLVQRNQPAAPPPAQQLRQFPKPVRQSESRSGKLAGGEPSYREPVHRALTLRQRAVHRCSPATSYSGSEIEDAIPDVDRNVGRTSR